MPSRAPEIGYRLHGSVCVRFACQTRYCSLNQIIFLNVTQHCLLYYSAIESLLCFVSLRTHATWGQFLRHHKFEQFDAHFDQRNLISFVAKSMFVINRCENIGYRMDADEQKWNRKLGKLRETYSFGVEYCDELRSTGTHMRPIYPSKVWKHKQT